MVMSPDIEVPIDVPMEFPNGAEVIDDGMGGAIVQSMEEMPIDIPDDIPFDANLAEYLDDGVLGEISSDLRGLYEEDLESRSEWEETYTKGLDLLGLRGKIAIIGIAKRLEEIYYPGDSIPMYLDKRSETLKIIQFLRNEAHRFGITLHRNKRSKSAIQSELEQIPTIGKQTITSLLRKFKSAKRVKTASYLELKELLGDYRAKKIYDYYHQ